MKKLKKEEFTFYKRTPMIVKFLNYIPRISIFVGLASAGNLKNEYIYIYYKRYLNRFNSNSKKCFNQRGETCNSYT